MTWSQVRDLPFLRECSSVAEQRKFPFSIPSRQQFPHPSHAASADDVRGILRKESSKKTEVRSFVFEVLVGVSRGRHAEAPSARAAWCNKYAGSPRQQGIQSIEWPAEETKMYHSPKCCGERMALPEIDSQGRLHWDCRVCGRRAMEPVHAAIERSQKERAEWKGKGVFPEAKGGLTYAQ